MKVHSIKTDNANIPHKVYLRKEATKGLKSLRVLDLFAGNNILWSNFNCEKYYGVEVVKGKGKNLNADNLRVIESLDLSEFNVIDCDSYGIPFQQIEKLYQNPTLQSGTVIIYTAIGNSFSALSKIAIQEFGFSEMYNKCPTLFNRMSDELFYGYLEKKGVKQVKQYEIISNFIKKYGFFIVN